MARAKKLATLVLFVAFAVVINFLALRSPKTTPGDRVALIVVDAVIALLVAGRIVSWNRR